VAGDLTPSEVRRWDASAIQQVFQLARKLDGTYKDFGDAHATAQTHLSEWGGEAGDAFHQEMGHRRAHIDMQGRLEPRLAAAVEKAETDANAGRAEMKAIDDEAAKHHWSIADSWIVDYSSNPNDEDSALEKLEQRLAALKIKALDADHELAVAMRAAVGDAQLDYNGREMPQAPPSQPSNETVPGPRPGDPPYDYHDGKQHPPPTMVPGANVVPLADNPPGFPPVGPGVQRDQNWQTYLNGQNPDGTRRVAAGVPPAALPNLEAVQDKGLRAIGAAGRQQGISYAWGANKSPYGPTKGDGDGGGDATKNHDETKTGFDCGGLVRFSEFQATGNDPFAHTGPAGSGTDDLDTSKYLTAVKGGIPGSLVGQFAQPGDVLVFGDPGHQQFSGTKTHHTGIYLGNGVIIDAPESGKPIRVDPLAPQWAREPTDVLRAK